MRRVLMRGVCLLACLALAWQARLAASKAKNKPIERDVRLERGAHGDFGVSLEDLDGGVIVSFVQVL